MSGKKIVLSKNGYGTGLAQLEKVAPKTFFKFCQLLKGHFHFDNLNGGLRTKVPGYDEIMSGTYISLDNKKFESNVLTPVNNSYFIGDYLLSGLNTLSDLIIRGKKLAFTYPISHNIGDIVLFSVYNSDKYIVCRVSDSYPHTDINIDMWSKFEGYDVSYIKNLELVNKGQLLFQNHIDFICTLDETGKLEFNDDLFGEFKPDGREKAKVVGQTTVKPVDVVIPQGLRKQLSKKGIEGEILKFPDSEKDYKLYKTEKYQVLFNETYYAIEYKKYPLWHSINILLTSKNSFL